MWPVLCLTTSLILELYLGSRVAELFEVPSSLQFVRDYVAKNVPVIIRNATLDWPAISKWNSKYFRCVMVWAMSICLQLSCI